METSALKTLRIQAPGRINLIGEHLDYNDGIVLPAAIDRFIEFTFQPTTDASVCVDALDLNEHWEFTWGELTSVYVTGWKKYVQGVFCLLKLPASKQTGLQISFQSTIPIGAGLSSSAALCCGLAFGLNEWFSLGYNRLELAKIAQQTEHEFAGVQCGLMDQIASLFGWQQQFIAFDCLNQTIEAFSISLPDCHFFLIDSNVKHNLATSAYNERVAQLNQAKKIAAAQFEDFENWRSLSTNQLHQLLPLLDEKTQLRVRYVHDELQRVQDFMEAALHQHTQKLGQLLNECHAGLATLYEVSCAELDFLQENCLHLNGVLGARMMGGGFGGCLLVLARSVFDKDGLETLLHSYQNRFGIEANWLPIELKNGVEICK
ncbi:MAG: Galactokinase [Bacteroidota bacterium]|jgi:galactokinase